MISAPPDITTSDEKRNTDTFAVVSLVDKNGDSIMDEDEDTSFNRVEAHTSNNVVTQALQASSQMPDGFLDTARSTIHSKETTQLQAIVVASGIGTDLSRPDTDHKLLKSSSPSEASTAPHKYLVMTINGMYRILDLIGEQGSGGLVDFKALDKLMVLPIGVYGDKNVIASLLHSIGTIDDSTSVRKNFKKAYITKYRLYRAEALRNSKDDSSGPRLRSGLYLARVLAEPASREHILAIYWPEDTTWRDDAATSVRRNRITFMRYLTKLADQLICLLSPAQSRSIIWKDEKNESTTADFDDGHMDRLFTFEVAKTNEQEENVTSRPGFNMSSPEIMVDPAMSTFPEVSDSFKLRLVAGETSQAFLRVAYIPSSVKTSVIDGKFAHLELTNLLASGSVELPTDMDDEALLLFIQNGLQTRYPTSCQEWKKRLVMTREECSALERDEMEKMKAELSEGEPTVKNSIIRALLEQSMYPFPMFERVTMLPDDMVEDLSTDASISQLYELYPALEEEIQRVMQADKWKSVSLKKLRDLKKRFVMAEIFLNNSADLDDDKREAWVRKVLDKGYTPPKASLKSILDTAFHLFGFSRDVPPEHITQAEKALGTTSDSDFLSRVSENGDRHHALLVPIAATILEIAHDHVRELIRKDLRYLSEKTRHVQELACGTQIQRLGLSRRANRAQESRQILAKDMQLEALPSARTVKLDYVKFKKSGYSTALRVAMTGKTTTQTEPVLQYQIHVLGLSSDHRHNLQLDPSFIPSPQVEKRLSYSFTLPVEHQILHVQILENRILLVIDDRKEGLSIYLETLNSIGAAIDHGRSRRRLRHDKIGKDISIAYDETKRMLSLCASTRLQLYIFVFDENYTSLQAWGNSLNLAPWYNSNISIVRSCFISGTEEILLIDTSGQARIFSLVTQQFRPASLSLPHIPTAAFASPDGACLVLLFQGPESLTLRAFHWATFGSTAGIPLDISPLTGHGMVLTSMVNRNSVHLLELDSSSNCCRSVALDITKKATEFMFKEKGSRNDAFGQEIGSVCNCLIDSHADVWTRFPVVPAVQRQAITSLTRRQNGILFVTETDGHRFASYFSDLVRSFEQRTRKLTGDELKNIAVKTIPFRDLISSLSSDPWDSSAIRAGEWLVDLLCLIPIHIAITRENRFVPLKDGVTSADLERALLGAEVGRIVDSLSLGWYESIFQSYMTDKVRTTRPSLLAYLITPSLLAGQGRIIDGFV
ncbi:hypothetical protein DXG03_003454 [Asterophora parasitica]|uniref:Uncharacterized protein n=1 Tax=Asterophora parasitica TaxID=117018 RepID=A0A9P7G9K8_9AGAR|nr:hypothetical protein DXG03_003454 [Asterophora parasitica]